MNWNEIITVLWVLRSNLCANGRCETSLAQLGLVGTIPLRHVVVNMVDVVVVAEKGWGAGVSLVGLGEG